ncbi:unnamed protein product [Ilex paraguariensis]|uniref:Uncharacterized protein n=1 Tax=Ilex paraguariensis TaxID=185542 RepID=A0ABC8TV49_9AQUA
MSGVETKKRKKVDSGGSSGTAKLFVDKDAKKRYALFIVKCPLLIERGVYLDEFVGSVDCPEILRSRKWEPLFEVSVEDKSVGAILGLKRANCVKRPSAVSQVVGSQAGPSQGGSDAGTSEGGQTLQQMVEKLKADLKSSRMKRRGRYSVQSQN